MLASLKNRTHSNLQLVQLLEDWLSDTWLESKSTLTEWAREYARLLLWLDCQRKRYGKYKTTIVSIIDYRTIRPQKQISRTTRYLHGSEWVLTSGSNPVVMILHRDFTVFLRWVCRKHVFDSIILANATGFGSILESFVIEYGCQEL